MASHPSNDNPWQDEASPTGARDNPYSGQGYQNPNTYSTYQDQSQSHPSHQQGQYAPLDHPPPHQQPLSSNPPGRYYQGGAENEAGWGGEQGYQIPPTQQSPAHGQTAGHTSTPNYPTQHTQNFSHNSSEEIPPSLPPRRSATDLALPTGQDRSHQIEVMQSYEASGRKDEHDQNVEVLQREFPKIDGSLIAAIYGDSQSLSATREMLGELE
ncbi:hypothetical protein BDU57DRAFT_512308 [Ampelomyces quisqualis]|uniref:CUE domain-containing protein n=1 Tax=Ampelomyces quisqualis TaxID=50730 RepID=A0A6A5QWH7_AMPQU|nr:hypothetical protein BDU57DRAFT_512308 [Ampelomyces quisqualis]